MNRNTKRLSAEQNRLSVRAAKAFKALGDENRVKIAMMLSSGPTNACDFMDVLEISQPTLSHHLKVLNEAGVINCKREGKWRIYELSESGTAAVEEINRFSKH